MSAILPIPPKSSMPQNSTTPPLTGMSSARSGTPGANGSAYYERIQRLSDRLSSLQTGLESEKQSRLDVLNSKLRSIDEKLTTNSEASAKKFHSMKEMLTKLTKTMEDERRMRDKIFEDKDSELRELDLNIQSIIETESQHRVEDEMKIIRTFEEKFSSMRDEIIRESKSRVENEVNLKKYLELDIPKLFEGLKEEALAREAMESRILRRAMEEIARLGEAIAAEKRHREESEESMIRMLEEVVVKMQGDLANERREREESEETLLRLLEDTCVKLNSAAVNL
jgi:hypothetical protein